MARLRSEVVAGIRATERDEVRATFREEHGQNIKHQVRVKISKKTDNKIKERQKEVERRVTEM